MAAIAVGVLTALMVSRWHTPVRTAWLLRIADIVGLLAVGLCGRELWSLLGNGYMLVLTLAAAMLIAGLHVSKRAPTAWSAGLRSFGRLSYEIYLSHMFVVFGLVALFQASGGDKRLGAWWYLPLLAMCWALGKLIARYWSEPCDRALRARWLRPALPKAAAAA